MTRGLRDALLLVLLLGAAAAFGAMILAAGPLPERPALPEPAPSAAETPATAFALPEVRATPVDQLGAALERPLFSRTRRPPTAPTPVASPLDATLAGVLTAGEEKVAIVLPAGAARARRLREGDLFHGWRVVQIDDYSVALERDGRTERLVLIFRGTPSEPN